MGETIFKELKINANIYAINTSNLQSGVHLVVLTTDNLVYVKKVNCIK